jgi:amino acid adenylation domain-containing protein
VTAVTFRAASVDDWSKFFGRLAFHVERRPDSPALTEGAVTLSYKQLADAVLSSAQSLQQRGVSPGDRVGILSRRSLRTVITILGVLACGAAYVPLDRSAPSDRLAFQAGDASLVAIVVDPEDLEFWSGVFGDGAFIWTLTDALGDGPTGASTDHFGSFPDASLAYVIYTSGSTGVPKGVAVTRDNLNSLLRGWDIVMGPIRHVSLLSSALSFDASVCELFWPLYAGGRLVVAPEPSSGAIGLELGALIRERRITHMQCTPTRASLMLADPDDRAALARLDHLVVGGESLPVPVARDLLAVGIRRLTNAYGPTEATVWATSHDVTRHDVFDVANEAVSVGVPIPGVAVEVVSALGIQAGVGERGELFVGGPFVTAGYLNRPELTIERFVTHAFNGSMVDRAYRTGDVAYTRADGSLVIVGRNDHQVKIRGHRLELGEVEAAVVAEPDVRACVACVLDRSHDRLAVAIVGDGGLRSSEMLIASLRERLPEVMVPEFVLPLDVLPTLSSGKADRHAVKELLLAAFDAHDHAVVVAAHSHQGHASADPLLEAMMVDFSIVLGREGITPKSDFFVLGGHSLAAVELVQRILARTGERISLRSLLSASTPEELLAWQSKGPDRPDRVIVKLSPTSGADAARRTLFLIHGAGGNVLRFRPLAQVLSDIVNVVGVQAVATEGGSADSDLQEMVARYAQAIVETQPLGPYEIGGYSAGGIIALHVGALLEERGHKVRSLVLLDPLDSSELAGGMHRASAVLENVRPADGLGFGARLRAAANGWRRRREWDADGAAALAKMGYQDLFDQIAALAVSQPAPRVNAPALLMKSSIENPFRIRRYDRATSSPRSVNVAWVGAKHDELLHAPWIPTVSKAIADFLRSV